MKQVTKFEAEDGQLFDTEDECERYDRKKRVVELFRKDIDLRDTSYDKIVNWFMLNSHLLKP
jgi:hypothetical protein